MKTIFFSITTLFMMCITMNAQNVIIPNQNFKNALLQHGSSIYGNGISEIDTNHDGNIQVNEAESYQGVIRVSGKNITDLTGIEAFVNLTELYCGQNQLTDLFISANIKLTDLECHQNQLTALDLNQNTNLVYLECKYNQLTSLDVHLNTQLQHLGCTGNQIASLDITQNPQIIELRAASNQLTHLNLANGYNQNIDLMLAYGNSELTCIQHDEGFDPNTKPISYSPFQGWFKGSGSQWSSQCNLGTDEIEIKKMAIYPNPTHDFVYIKTQEPIESIRLFDAIGNQVHTYDKNTRMINLHSFPKGVYFLEIVHGAQYDIQKLIKE